MVRLQFRCRLLTDVILNSSSATESINSTLDYIPGSCFLGIVARDYARYAQEGLAHALFHSGQVQFGDAHPAYTQGEKQLRSWRTPAAFFRPKLDKEQCFVHFAIPDPASEELVRLQLRQERKGFWAFETSGDTTLAHPVNPTTNFTLKSAYDSEHRRAKDEQLFGYEALRAGMDFLFSVVVEEGENTGQVVDALQRELVGKRRVGRSRSAQYGLVEIEPYDFPTITPSISLTNGRVAVYAESRLCFTDEWGMSTAMPTAQQLGFAEGAKIDWEHSQVRTFRYSPWNAKRGYADAERFGIEKGSVMVVEASALPDNDAAVGEYRNEGFGRVCYNPAFLKADAEGRSTIQFEENSSMSTEAPLQASGYTSPLLDYLQAQKKAEEVEYSIYELVNEWMKEYAHHFTGVAFASQWGTIRSLAMQYPDADRLVEKLFGRQQGALLPIIAEKDDNAYLRHGVAQQKWDERGRIKRLLKFVHQVWKKEEKPHLGKALLASALINLSSQMAKHCKR